MEKIIHSDFKDFISGYSIEVIPRSAAKIESFVEVLPKNTRVYIAHIQNEDILSMVATAKELLMRVLELCLISQQESSGIRQC